MKTCIQRGEAPVAAISFDRADGGVAETIADAGGGGGARPRRFRRRARTAAEAGRPIIKGIARRRPNRSIERSASRAVQRTAEPGDRCEGALIAPQRPFVFCAAVREIEDRAAARRGVRDRASRPAISLPAARPRRRTIAQRR